jgi:transcriptional regulator with XRE-family HTH domain
MARNGLTFGDVVQSTGLDERTVRGLARGTNKPHARTLNKLAEGIGVPVDELFFASGFSRRSFDRATNSEIGQVIDDHAGLFNDWSDADFDELYSQFGTGGALCEAGVLTAAEWINAKRSLLRQVCVILESDQAELLAGFVALLFRQVAMPGDPADGTLPSARPAAGMPNSLKVYEFDGSYDR